MGETARQAGRKRGRLRRWAGRLLLVLGGTVVALLVAEGLTRLFALDETLIATTLYYQDSNPVVYQRSDDPVLLYELAPGTRWEEVRGHDPADESTWVATVNEHGARGRAYPIEKGPGVFRVLSFGGSTTFGHGVGDDETWPAGLERALADRLPGRRVEVWNFGHQAYTLAQAAHLARRELARLAPDLVLVQLYNAGRRPFLFEEGALQADYTAAFEADPRLYVENYPPPSFLAAETHVALFRHVALYRVGAAVARWLRGDNGSAVGEAISCEEAIHLMDAARARSVPVVFVRIPAMRRVDQMGSCLPAGLPEGAHDIDLYAEGREDWFYDPHPPPPFLDEFGRTIAARLAAKGLLP